MFSQEKTAVVAAVKAVSRLLESTSESSSDSDDELISADKYIGVVSAVTGIKRLLDSSSSSSSDSDSELVVTLVINIPTELRPRIESYVESTVSQYSDREFKTHFRISRDTFLFLLEKIGPVLNGVHGRGQPRISAEKQILIAIWTFATPDSYRLEHMDRREHPGQSSDQNFSECERSYLAGRGFKRYNNSLKNLIPIRREGKDNGTLPVDSAGLLSVISFSWLSKFMYQAHSKGLTLKELPNVSPYDSCIYNVKRLELLWKDELAKRGPEKASCLRVVWRFSRTRVVADSIVAALSIGFGFLGTTVFMRKLLESIQSGEGTYGEGIKWALLLSAAELMRTLFFTWTCAMSYRTALRVRSACMTLVYRKIIRVNNLGNKSIGEVINIFSNDAQKIFDMVFNLPSLVAGPILTVFVIFYILWLFSPMALLGMTAFILYYPVQYAVTRLSEFLQSKAVKISDTRIRLMNEILNCIKLIKMYAWEKRFSQQILETREEEQQVLLKTLYCQGLNASMAPTIPIISVIITFLAHVYGGNNLTAAQGILLLEDSDNSTLKPILKSQAVVISDGTFAGNTFGDQKEQNSQTNEKERNKERVYSGVQNGKEAPLTAVDHGQYIDVLFDISFEAGKGKLVGICGHVGSGKTSLLLAALGQLQVSKGQVMRDGSCAYVSQEAWITNATLRENILFGSQFDHDRYYEVIYSCNLSQDISMMPGGDQTEIGEKGVNLSGGQKQRVALARALYADRDIYFLDDPLSAVDARVGSHIFDNLINGALAQKTVLFVSHQIQYLNRCDDIYMMRAGRIIEHGTHEELMKLGNEYALMVEVLSSDSKTAKSATEDSSQNVEVCPPSADANPLNQKTISHDTCGSRHDLAKPSTSSGAPLTVADSIEKGTIKAHTYHSYIVAAGGYCFSFTIMLTFLVTVGSTTFSSWWLALWIKAGGGNTTIVRNNETTVSDNINDNPDFWYYQSIYGASIGVIILTSLLRTLIFTKATIRASTELHKTLFVKIIECPMRFFETTPSGRLQHLFSRDMDEVDNRLPVTLTNVIQYIFILSFAMLAICLVIPWFILPLCVLTAVYYFISKIFRAAIRDLRRLENKSRAPMLGLVATTVQGLSTIHAFGKETDFTTKFMNMFDENSKCLYLCNVGIRWLAVRLDCLSVLVTGITAFFVISLPDQVPPALAGLALSYSAHISGVFQFAIRMVSETEVRLISVERINYYLRTLKSEGGTDAPSVETPLSWPEVAKIKFNNVNMAYGESSPYSLKNISFTIDAGEKIGIVGRTGSGKSSLTVALFRLFELTQGHIEIDDIDISKISLDQLRRKLSIIPQDPVLFSGTIRSNLDPFHLHNDAEIWQALENTKLSDRVRSITGQLDASVGFGGDNLSVGEKQLLCLSRALLRNSKVLVLDEATAAVDPETEIAVQNTIQQAFVSCTVLTIAHRLKTVLSLDRVLVMDDGKLIEFDTPTNLLKDRNSEFYKMMAAAEKVLNQ